MTQRILFIFALFLVGCEAAQKDNKILSEKERWELHAANTEIIRDDFGVPHIYGKTDADAVFGLLYAQCEDDFNRVERNYIWAIGRLAEVEGEEAIYSDLRAKLYMSEEKAKENLKNSPQWLQTLCQAFADGINFYLDTHPEVKPKLLTRFEPWMPMYFSEGSIGGDIESISTEQIKDFYEKSSQNLSLNIHQGFIQASDDEPRGSNGFAIAGERTASGAAMLLINPHTSFFFRGEVHVVSEEGLNAYGAVTWGQFFVYQGFNEKTGWMHTSTGVDMIDQFEETIQKTEKGLTYKYGDEFRAIDSAQVTLKYKTEKGFKEKSFMTYHTHHGPITHGNGDKWVATALMWSPVKALEQSYTRTKQSNHKEFYKIMDIRTNSSNNTVYADADGNIAYYHGNFIPKRDTSFDYSKPVDGSNPKTDWQGIHELKDNILVLNPKNGWIQNCNSTPFTSAGKYSPKRENYPNYMATFPENFRGIHAIPLLEAAKNLTLDKLIELAYDPYLPGADTLMKGVIRAYEQNPTGYEDLKESVETLKKWDFKVSKETIAMTMSDYYLKIFNQSREIPEGNYMEKLYYIASGAAPKLRLDIFRKALTTLKEDFGTTQVPWGEYNRYQRLDGEVQQIFNDSLKSMPVGMASSRWGALASFGARRGENTRRQYGVAGNSFVAVVEFGKRLKAKSILAGGQSGDPASPHFDDQLMPYIDCKFKEVAFYKEDVLKRAKKRYHPGEK